VPESLRQNHVYAKNYKKKCKIKAIKLINKTELTKIMSDYKK